MIERHTCETDGQIAAQIPMDASFFHFEKICEVRIMYPGHQSNAEVNDIWQKYRGTLQSQQMQMATERDSLVGVTVEKEVGSLKNTHFHHLVMHLSMEDMILSQLDLIWENYIVSAYNSNYSHDLWPISGNDCRFIAKVAAASGRHILYEHSIAFYQTSVGDIGFKSALYDIFIADWVKETIWNQNIAEAMKRKNRWRKRKANAQLGREEKRTKRPFIINKHGDLHHYFMESIDFIPCAKIESKDQDSFIKPCEKREASSEKNTSMSMILSAPETCCNVIPGSKMSDDGCYFGSAVKSLVRSSFSLGVAKEVFSSTFIPQADSSVDYKMLCGSLQQKGHGNVLADSDESLCLTNNTDSNINLHVRLSEHPCILTTDVILSDVNRTEPGERQGQNCFNWTACERRMIQDEKLKSSLTNKSLLPCIVNKNRHCGETFLTKEKTFSTQLDINFAILAASLLGNTKDDFLFFPILGFQSTSCQMTDESFASRHEGLQYEQAEVEVSLGGENINIITRTAQLEYKSALNKQDFCFPSHFQSGVDTKQSEKETSGNNVDFYVECSWSKQVSCTERFQKICLEKCLLEPESHNKIYCSFRNEMLIYKSGSREDNMTTMEENHSGCISECQIIKTKLKHQSCTKQFKNKERNEVQTGNMNSGAAQHNVEWEKEDGEEDMTFKNFNGMEEENQNVKVSILNGHWNRSPVSCVYVETITSENSEQEIKEEASLVLKKEITDVSIEGSKAMLKNTDFEMKAQFDLVLEELKMFHLIEVEDVETIKTQDAERLEEACGKSKELQDEIEENSPSCEVIVGSDCKDLMTIEDYECDRKITSEVSEQEVPQPCMSSYPRDEESLYSADNVEVIPKSLSWKPAFLNSSDTETNISSYPEKAVTFSHGIGRVTPLKTRSGPLRIGLSKKAKIKQLHPYLR
ncbi:RAD51-associated protein 2 [Dendrobates tinctorius]|uniref:RAD51-associated protein 2 n=1 Tax=Dendrobates tinctorius TaxID=92724 RepID=UPI003CC943D7